jgi:hypothetical protein
MTLPTSGGRSVGIVRSRTQAMEFVCLFYISKSPCISINLSISGWYPKSVQLGQKYLLVIAVLEEEVDTLVSAYRRMQKRNSGRGHNGRKKITAVASRLSWIFHNRIKRDVCYSCYRNPHCYKTQTLHMVTSRTGKSWKRKIRMTTQKRK